ncbi:MAG TPA: sugar phosphate isomerase/epimerase [Propionibacteriaceae bacterium]|nr:sugar phosphate isomerase/epimerase [Propionibacteriaceae bacterium]
MSELSVQLYTLRKALEQDFNGTLQKLAGFGFTQVEPFQLLAFADQLRAGLRPNGLTAPTTHVHLLDGNQDEICELAAELGIQTIIEPYVDPTRWQAEADVSEIASELNEVAQKAARYGLTVGYHNHHFELESKISGVHALEVFADRLAPEVVLEVDTYWAYAGGADVPALLKRLGDRVVALHLKDGDGTLDTKKQVAVGSGVVPVRDIIAAVPDALWVVELDDSESDLLEAVRASREFLLAERI